MRSIIFLTFLLMLQAHVQGQTHWRSVIIAEDVWNYLPATSEPPANWMSREFNDSEWDVGAGGIGYSDGDDQTVIDPVNSLYLRNQFYIPPESDIQQIILDVDYDDAFVAYLNGVEVARSTNIIGDFPAFNQELTIDREAQMYTGGLPERYEVEISMIDSGWNTLAVQIVNFGIGSSDLSSLIFMHALLPQDLTYFRNTPGWFIPPTNITSGKLPLFFINTGSQVIQDEPRIVAELGIINNGPGALHSEDDPFNEYDGRITIEIRGQSSQMFPKKSFSIETQDSLGENNNVSLLGMPAENDWILYAPYSDKSMLRNAVTFELGARTGQYCSGKAYCELFINGEYQGVYILMEKIKRDDNRVDIATLRPEDNIGDELTGGYIFKVDKIDNQYSEGYSGFISRPEPSYPNAMDINYQYFDPKPDELTIEQKEYLMDHVIEAEAVLISDYFEDPDIGYNRYLNSSSFVDFMLINEISKEVDKYRYSSYFYKKKESKGGEIFAGPIWDFNLGYANVDYWPYGLDTDGWLYTDVNSYDWSIIFWWKRLMEDPFFNDLATTRWKHLRENEFSDAAVNHLIDSLTTLIDEAQERNFVRWPILGTYVWPNYNWQNNTYADEVEYFSSWLFDRLNWMDMNFTGKVLEPAAAIEQTSRNSQLVNYKIALTDDQFTNHQLRSKYFDLQTANSSLTVDSVYYVDAQTAILAVKSLVLTDLNGSQFSVGIDDDILNGFRTLHTNEVLVSSENRLYDPANTVIYSLGNSIYIKSTNPESLPEYIDVISVTGQIAGRYTIQNSRLNVLPVNLDAGLYVVQIRYANAVKSEKVVLSGSYR